MILAQSLLPVEDGLRFLLGVGSNAVGVQLDGPSNAPTHGAVRVEARHRLELRFVEAGCKFLVGSLTLPALARQEALGIGELEFEDELETRDVDSFVRHCNASIRGLRKQNDDARFETSGTVECDVGGIE